MHAELARAPLLGARRGASGAPGLAPSARASGRVARRRRSALVARAADDDPFKNFNLGKLAKKVQGAIPVVSLVSKLLSPEGGIGGEALSYNEYCRAKLDAAGGTAFGDALSRLCDDCGKEPRTVLLLAWMVYEGRGTCGFEPARSAAVRLASTGFDYEYEIYRFEQARDAAKAAAGRGRDDVNADADAAAAAAAEAIATCAYGGGEGAVSDEMRAHIETVARATMEAV